MFGFTARSTATLLGAALVASSMLTSGAFAMAQQTPMPRDPGACARGTTWHVIMPNNADVVLPCPRVLGEAMPQLPVQRAHLNAPAAPASNMREPLYTGSIKTAQAAPSANRSLMVKGPQDCRPGAYWLMSNPNQDTPMACP